VAGGFVVGLAMVALALGATGAVGKAKAPSPRIPSCAHFSVAQLGRYVNIHPLVLESRTGNLCGWLVTETTRYDLLLFIQVEPGTIGLYGKIELADQKAAEAHGAQFHVIPRADGGKALMFHAMSTVSSSSLPACKPSKLPPFGPPPLPPLGPPACNGQPAQFKDNVVGFIPPKPHAAHGILVSLAVAAELGDVSDSHMIALTNAILNGKVR
jgi:hypothetical protein